MTLLTSHSFTVGKRSSTLYDLSFSFELNTHWFGFSASRSTWENQYGKGTNVVIRLGFLSIYVDVEHDRHPTMPAPDKEE